ncbi:QueE-like radical SAM domain [Vibrio phage D479]
MKNTNKIRYSEMFMSVQGEGAYTGRLSVWIRMHKCNLQCRGFSQPDPLDRSTWKLEYDEFAKSDQLIALQKIEDLPVFKSGCDSYYSWHPAFKRFMFEDSAEDIATQLLDLTPQKSFVCQPANADVHLCFTGGEAMINQDNIQAIIEELIDGGDFPTHITIETNGTQKMRPHFRNFLQMIREEHGVKVTFSMSPKLPSVTGESAKKTIRPEVVRSYEEAGYNSFLKFVVNPDERSWNDLDKAVAMYREAGVTVPIWVMPVGATQQEQESHAGELANRAIALGYNVSARVHNYLWGNAVGV